jgi:glutaminyl-peptide cyclotransferase
MKTKILLFFAAASLVYGCSSCNKNKPVADITVSPEAGTRYKAGDIVQVKVSLGDNKPDSIVYLVDSVRFASKKDSSVFSLKTDSMPLGSRLITARLYVGGKSQESSTNIVLLAAKAPEEYTYQVIKKYPHDTSSYTEGLLYQDGYLYESTGNPGHSTLRKVNLETGKALQVAKLDDKYFGEGSAIIGDKILMLTYRDPRVGLVYDKNTFKLLKTFPYNVGVEGWGLCFDGKKLYTDDSTNRIWFLDKDDYHPTGFIDVYDEKDSIPEVNELEYINGKLYSNIYTKDTIIVINPKTGAVEQRVDMKNLWPLKDRPAGYNSDENVLNGIAWDEKGKRLFVTGKKWPYLYQVKFVKK